MNAFCYIYNEIKVLKREAQAIEQHHIDVLRKSAQEIKALLHTIKREGVKT